MEEQEELTEEQMRDILYAQYYEMVERAWAERLIEES